MKKMKWLKKGRKKCRSKYASQNLLEKVLKKFFNLDAQGVYPAQVLWVSDKFRIYFCETDGIPETLQNISQLQQPVSSASFMSPEAAIKMGMDLCTWTWVPTEPYKCPVTFPAKSKTKTHHTKITAQKK